MKRIDYVKALDDVIDLIILSSRLNIHPGLILLVGEDFYKGFKIQLIERVLLTGQMVFSGNCGPIKYRGFEIIRTPDIEAEPVVVEPYFFQPKTRRID